jgi:3-hydroxyacyl-CoA dehydrogenase/enoyl-CoA hydratase/3-hydroxybutyryl-CoA epimerase/enoyl-CoA isomerase
MAKAVFEGQSVQVLEVGELPGALELKIDLKGESVNKFNASTLEELKSALALIQGHSGLKGLLVTSGKDVFVVGADVTEFTSHFKRQESELNEWLMTVNKVFNGYEDLPVPSVAAINGFCLGGGCEFALTAAFRLMSPKAKIGLPETKLGIYPGWGGTVRLPRLIGVDNAVEWIASGNQYGAEDALKFGTVDGVCAPDALRSAAMSLLGDAIAGKVDWKSRQERKKKPLLLNKIEAMMSFETCKAFVGSQAGPNYPAPMEAIRTIEQGARLTRDEALPIEAKGFVKMAKTTQAQALVGIFLGDQQVKKVAKGLSKSAQPVKSSAVLGAGIMGGGIAYQSAYSGVPVFMKDIQEGALELGMNEASKILDKLVSRGKLTTAKMAKVLSAIRPTLSYGEMKGVDLVVEAVTENEKVKRAVLADAESNLSDSAILTSNTSTISITGLAESLKRPEKFCGMHFFNPVPRMPLVEIIRGKKTSETTIATAVAYASTMGKTAVVVNDCTGFLVNRVLFPYFAGFFYLLRDGVPFQKIDTVMQKWGWPMGPAYLLDVVGIDTAVHANNVMATGYPDRMKLPFKPAIDVMLELKRLGQKNGKGFYLYKPDKKGNPAKEVDPEVEQILKPHVGDPTSATAQVSDEEIIERMMLPMLIESARCLEEKVVGSAVETDISLLYGLGFPPFRGGIFRWADAVGLSKLNEQAAKYRRFGNLYEPCSLMRELEKSGRTFF